MPVNRTKTIAVGTSAVAWNPDTEFFAGLVKVHRYLLVTNRGNTGIGVNPFGTAAIDGDDTKYIAPGDFAIFERKQLSIISDAANGKVEIDGDNGRR